MKKSNNSSGILRSILKECSMHFTDFLGSVGAGMVIFSTSHKKSSKK